MSNSGNRLRQIRMKAPEDLTLPQKNIWNQIVHSVPDFHFTPQHVDLLRRYCVLAATLRMFQEWEDEVLANEGIEGLYYTDDNGKRIEDPKCKRIRDLANEMHQLSYKLRILPQEQHRIENKKRDQERQNIREGLAEEVVEMHGENLLYQRPDA